LATAYLQAGKDYPGDTHPLTPIILADIKKSTTLLNKVVQLGRINKSNIS